MSDETGTQIFIFQEYVNSFEHLYYDAEFLYRLAKETSRDRAEAVRLCRTSILLYILSLEGLINRALFHFLPERFKSFILEKERYYSIEDKWRLLPLFASENDDFEFDYSGYPWSHFVELIQIRNEFVHPKHDRPAFSKAITSHRFENLSWKEIPEGSGIHETDVVFRQTRVPRNPRSIFTDDVEKVKRVVDDIIKELDRLLDGKITSDQWIVSNQLKLIYPEGATLRDNLSLERTGDAAGKASQVE